MGGMAPPGMMSGMRPPGLSHPGSGQMNMMGAQNMMIPRPPMGGLMPPPPGAQMMQQPQGGVRMLAQELAALVSAGASGHGDQGQGFIPQPNVIQLERKPQLVMLIAQMAPKISEHHMQQVLEQCGEVQAFRRGKDGAGQPLSFGVALFADPESAWKASSCLSKRMVAGQEIKVLLEENTEVLINKWKATQKAVLRVKTDEELEWELERKAFGCKALIDAKLEELYGLTEGGSAAGGAAAQRRQELREREKNRVERATKRKAWREAEFTRELGRVESSEKSLRDQESAKDNAEREKEDTDLKEKQAREAKLEKLEADGGATSVNVGQLADNRSLMEMIDKVQEEPREGLFRVRVDPNYLRNERIMERKLRPWLEKKVDLYMGGQTSDLVEHIIRRVNAVTSPDPLIAELERFLDDNAEGLVERMFRMISLELMQDGLVLPSEAKRAKKEEIKEEKKW